VTARRERVESVDGYRAIAALAVVVFHVAFLGGETTRWAAGWALARLDVGVSLFFVLSGFLLYRPFAVAHLRGDPMPALGPYFRRRLLRIFPAYWLALAVLAAVGEFRPKGVAALVQYALILQPYDRFRVFDGVLHQAWTLAVEVGFYVFLPVFAALVARHGGPAQRRARAQEIAVATVVVVGLAARGVVLAADPASLALLWFPTHLAPFGLGMALCSLRARESVGLPRPQLLRVVDQVRWYPLLLAAAAFWAVSTQLDLPRTPELVVYSFGQELGRHVLFAATAAFVLSAGVIGSRGRVHAVLSFRPLRWFGAVSYGVYLAHVDVLERLIKDPDPGRLPFWLLFGRVALVSLVAATISYIVIERPLQRVARWRGPSRRRRSLVPEMAGGLR
jgi:peptidoglycan/LPS O-acetylase OafA/YrhL